jgi:hypothetical protein
MKQYVCIVLVGLVLLSSQNVYGQDTGDPISLTYDLLFVAVPVTGNWRDTDFSDEARSLYHYDSVTQEITRLAVMDNLFGPQAISPDEQYLAVLRDDQMCLVDESWETLYCVPYPVTSTYPTPNHYSSYPPHTIYWDTDGAGFWLQYVEVPDNVDGSQDERRDVASELRHYDTAAGEITETIDFQELIDTYLASGGEYYYPANVVYVQDFDPELKIIIFANWRLSIADVDTAMFQPLYDDFCCISPVEPLLACADYPKTTKAVVNLSSIEEIFGAAPWEYISTLLPNETTWSDTLELDQISDSSWQFDTSLAWSHDGNMLGFYVVDDSVETRNTFGQNALVIYFMDTYELRVVNNHEQRVRVSALQWAPDDQWLVSTGYGNNLRISLDFDIASIDGQVQEIPLVNEDGERFTVISTAWIPRGWLQLDELQE